MNSKFLFEDLCISETERLSGGWLPAISKPSISVAIATFTAIGIAAAIQLENIPKSPI